MYVIVLLRYCLKLTNEFRWICTVFLDELAVSEICQGISLFFVE
jgi:hypothetical protein